VAVTAALLLVGGLALAHDTRPGAVALEERADGAWAVRVTPAEQDGRSVRLDPVWPEGCRATSGVLRCTEGLHGRLELPALATQDVRALVVVRPREGAPVSALLDARDPGLDLGEGPRQRGWLRLGLSHALLGFDHVLLVVGLSGLGLGWRRLVGAVTAFTAGHSLTLALAALGVLPVAGIAVELLIAGSVLLLAHEITAERPGATRRWPWLVTAAFGLVHGLGYAAALTELGLPEGGRVGALLGFNIGVELAQVVVLVSCLGVAAGWRRLGLPHGRRAVGALVGLPAGVWTVGRLVGWIATLG
jgi:hypothetical protein